MKFPASLVPRVFVQRTKFTTIWRDLANEYPILADERASPSDLFGDKPGDNSSRARPDALHRWPAHWRLGETRFGFGGIGHEPERDAC